jgi:LysM repeat protein
MPAPSAPKPAPVSVAAAGAYTVADGDTLWSVAKRLGVSAEALAEANPGVDARHMSIGQSLAVPAGANLSVLAEAAPLARTAAVAHAAVGSSVHVVADGDNFWNVAKRHDISVAALTRANPGVDPTHLRIGQSLALPGAGTAETETAGQGLGDRYVVADGDNLWSIAHRLGIDVERLTRANATVNPLKLQPGQVLTLPATAQAESGRGKSARHGDRASLENGGEAALYPVAAGDTLWGLARRFGVDLETILAVNGEIDPSRLRVGQLVTIPGGGPLASAEALSFPVSPGDTLWSIARRFDVSVESLVAANPGVDPLRLRQGQALRVPSSLAAVAAAAAAKGEPVVRPTVAPAAARPDEAPVAAPTALDATVRVHTVSEGDTLWDLSRRYGVSVAAILSQNTGLDPVRLQVGQTVRLPGSTVAMAAR